MATVKLLHVCDECGETTGHLAKFSLGSIEGTGPSGGNFRLTLDPPQRLCVACYHLARIEAAGQGLEVGCLLDDGSTEVERVELDPVAA